MNLENRIAKLERAVNISVGDEPTSMVDDPRFYDNLCGALGEEGRAEFAARWPEFSPLFSPSDRSANRIEEAIRAAGMPAVEDTGASSIRL